MACRKQNVPSSDEWPPVNGYRSPTARRGFRLAALIAVIIGVLAVAAGAFVLSYPGVRDLARTGGLSWPLAKIYPVIFDAMLVVACAAAFSLQGARWWLRSYSWLVLLVIAAAVAAADSMHATSVTLPKRPLEATVAIVPWAVLLIGFTLLYAMARQAWPHLRGANGQEVRKPPVAAIAAEPSSPAGPAAGSEQSAATPGTPGSGAPSPDTPDSGAPSPGPPESGTPQPDLPAPGTPEPDAAEPGPRRERSSGNTPLSELLGRRPDAERTSPELPVRRIMERDDPSDADAEPAPHFNRLRSTPTPPED